MRIDEFEGVTQSQLNALEKVLDQVFAKLGIDVEFTRHFLDRVNDERNVTPITIKELGQLFAKEFKKWGKPIAQMGPDAEAVMKDLSSDINLPFALNWNKQSGMLELVAKTVMRKKNFRTPNKEFPVESTEQVEEKGLPKNYNPDSETYKNATIGGRIPNSKSISKRDITVKGKKVDFPDGATDDTTFGDFYKKELKQTALDVISELGKREQLILKARFGFEPFNKSYTIQQVASAMDLSPERIRQIEAKALRMLKHPSRSRRLRSYMDENGLPPHLAKHFDKDGDAVKGSWKDGKWTADKKQPKKVKYTVKDVTPKGYGPLDEDENDFLYKVGRGITRLMKGDPKWEPDLPPTPKGDWNSDKYKDSKGNPPSDAAIRKMDQLTRDYADAAGISYADALAMRDNPSGEAGDWAQGSNYNNRKLRKAGSNMHYADGRGEPTMGDVHDYNQRGIRAAQRATDKLRQEIPNFDQLDAGTQKQIQKKRAELKRKDDADKLLKRGKYADQGTTAAPKTQQTVWAKDQDEAFPNPFESREQQSIGSQINFPGMSKKTVKPTAIQQPKTLPRKPRNRFDKIVNWAKGLFDEDLNEDFGSIPPLTELIIMAVVAQTTVASLKAMFKVAIKTGKGLKSLRKLQKAALRGGEKAADFVLGEATREELLSQIRSRQEKDFYTAAIQALRHLINTHGSKQSVSGYAFEIARAFNGVKAKELLDMYKAQYESIQEFEAKQSNPLVVLDKLSDRRDNIPFPVKFYDGNTIDVTPKEAKRFMDRYYRMEPEQKEIVHQYIKTKNGFLQAIKKVNVTEAWSEKYKKSIDCSNPKGFSQKAHCDGRKKK